MAEIKKYIKSLANCDLILRSPEMVSEKIKRCFMRAAQVIIRTKSLTKLLNSKVC